MTIQINMQTHQILYEDLFWFICSQGQEACALGKRKETKCKKNVDSKSCENVKITFTV